MYQNKHHSNRHYWLENKKGLTQALGLHISLEVEAHKECFNVFLLDSLLYRARVNVKMKKKAELRWNRSRFSLSLCFCTRSGT